MAARRLVFAGLGLAALAATGAAAQSPTWVEVGALFAERCTMCHSGEQPPAGLRLDSLDRAMAGSARGPVLVAGEPDASELVRRIRGASQPRMPLTGPPFLADAEIALVEAWVAAGMPAGDGAAAPEPAAAPAAPAPGETVTFAHVEPIFLQRCVHCHSDARQGGPPQGLRLDSYETITRGGERVALIPGNPAASEIVRRAEGVARPRMPLDGPPFLAGEQIDLLRRWIEDGARDVAGNPAPMPAGRELRLRGVLTGETAIDGAAFAVDASTRVDDRPEIGGEAEMEGVVEADGSIRAERLRGR